MESVAIGKIEFLDKELPIYYDESQTSGQIYCGWRARNPDSYYTGIAYIGANNKIIYPEGAIVPKQTEEDREQLPFMMIVGNPTITPKMEEILQTYLQIEYKRRNGR